jgi:diguanylate cyclase
VSQPTTGAELFSASAQRVVDYLNAHTPLGDWSVSRVTGGEQVHVHVHHEDVIEVGMRVEWSESFCRPMVARAPRVVADTANEPANRDLYAATPVRAYAGVPINDDDGSLFGVLCGVGSRPLLASESVDEELLRVFGDLLSAQLVTARRLDRERRQAEVAEALALRDGLTGLLNRAGWDRLVHDAEQRVHAFGDLVSVAVIDLDGLKQVNDTEGHQAGDELLRRAADALRDAERVGDRIARYGGDEFAVLANNVPAAGLEAYFSRLVDALARVGVSASIGWAVAGPEATVAQAFRRADAAMYTMKSRRAALSHLQPALAS